MIGKKVRDYPSNQVCTILDVSLSYHDDDSPYITVLLDAPPDPTHDGAFTTGWRNLFEIGNPLHNRPIDWTY